MDERWAVTAENPRYEVSDLGRVRNRETGHVLTPGRNTNLYLSVVLGKGKQFRVHRLVGRAFCEGWFDGAHINHKNGIRDDNRAVNLEWVTASENHKHAHRMPTRKANRRKVTIYVDGVAYPNQKAAAKALGVVQGSISSAIINGHRCKGREITRD